jgi:PAT family beta-lactamase induction signal transducer AmpG
VSDWRTKSLQLEGIVTTEYVAALFIPQAPQGTDIALVHQALMYGASAIESFAGGSGTAAFLMAIVDKTRATTEYAILSSIFAFSRSIAGWPGGVGAQELGYASYFALSFILAFPAYALLPWIKTILAFSQEGKE